MAHPYYSSLTHPYYSSLRAYSLCVDQYKVGMYREGVLTSKVSVADNLKYYSKCLIPYGLGHDEKMLVANARLAGMFDEAL